MNKDWREEFDKRFELEFEGCSECGGANLIDLTQVRFPKSNYHCEWDLEKIKDFIESLLKEEHERTLEESLEEIGSWDYDTVANSTPYQLYKKYIESLKV